MFCELEPAKLQNFERRQSKYDFHPCYCTTLHLDDKCASFFLGNVNPSWTWLKQTPLFGLCSLLLTAVLEMSDSSSKVKMLQVVSTRCLLCSNVVHTGVRDSESCHDMNHTPLVDVFQPLAASLSRYEYCLITECCCSIELYEHDP